MDQPLWNFEQQPYPGGSDETDINLRAYFDRMPDERMRQYDRAWSDEELMQWDGNFRSDGKLMLICSERDVEVEDYRAVIEVCIEYRNSVRGTL
jgi:hypothetical protein